MSVINLSFNGPNIVGGPFRRTKGPKVSKGPQSEAGNGGGWKRRDYHLKPKKNRSPFNFFFITEILRVFRNGYQGDILCTVVFLLIPSI